MHLTTAVRCLLVALVPVCATAHAATIYVSTAGSDTADGLTWLTAKQTVQAGLDAAAAGDQVWVAAGTYVQCITLKLGVGLYSGFTGAETDLGQRNWTTNVTILDGNNVGTVVTVSEGATETTRIDGFTIRNGSGSGIHCYYSSPTITNNAIFANGAYYGGGIYCDSSSPTIANNTITGNSACFGGGIVCLSNSSPMIVNNTITGNSAYDGGGIYCDSSAAITNTIIAFNSSGICMIGGTPSLSRNCVYGNATYDFSGLTDPTGTNGNISLDPKLGNLAGGNIHLQPTSPCIDAGDDVLVQSNWTDIDGQLRIQGLHVDIGADESDGTTWPAPPVVIYVRPGGNNGHDGLTWTTAKQTVQAGIDAAGTGTQVWVAAGTYVENIQPDFGVALYGGFAGHETDLSQRNWSTNITILDGNQTRSVVMTPPAATAATRIDGFTIRNSSASGGIYCVNSSPTIANNIISNYGNLGIRCRSASPKITGNTISGKGTAILCDSSSPTIINNTISGNFEGIDCYEGSPTIASNTISGNGTGVYCSYQCSPAITSNTISGNHDGYGGIYCENECAPTIINNTVSDNSGYYGGIYCRSSSSTIVNNTISGNSSNSYPGSGGIYCSGSAIIANNMITGNTGHSNAGGICLEYCIPATLVNNTITANSGAGIYAINGSTVVANCIVAFNSYGIDIARETGTPTLRYNCVCGNTESNYLSVTDPTGTNGNISVDPKLANVSYDNVHIQPDSPCIDAGDDSVIQAGWLDRDGQPRILGAHVDIGADESDGTVWAVAPNIIIRVSPQGNDANDGSSWALAKRTVQAAIDAVAVTRGEVWVAAGTYAERITLRKHAHVYGGFAGTEAQRSGRDAKRNATILDGSQGGCVVTATNIPYQFGTIDGFTIRNGKTSSWGGGIYCSRASVTIANNTITGNTASAGAGIAADFSSPVIANNTIIENVNGGGIYCVDPGSPTIISNTIASNSGKYNGVGICIDWCTSATITDNTIADNGPPSGTDSTGIGGGIYCSPQEWLPDGSFRPVTISGNTITGNHGNSKGGGIYCESESWSITQNVLSGNSAGAGGGIYCNSSGWMANNTITGNVAVTGGGIYCAASPTIANNIIAGNITFVGSSDSYGVGIYCAAASSPTIVNNTIAANNSPYLADGAIYCADTSSPSIINTIVAFNSSGIYKESGTGTPTLRSNCVFGNSDGNYSGLADPTGTNGNISSDPKLVDLSYHSLHIQADSPCVDAGDDGVVQATWRDMDGQTRVSGPHVDIGADESDGRTWSTGPNMIVHVAPDGNDANDGSSWLLAKRTVQAGIDAAAAAGGEVWVKAGTYVERINLYPYAYLYGGFAGTETQRSDRDWTRNVTVLDGGQAGSVVTADCIPPGLATIDGFTIRNGKARYGAGINCWQASVTITNNTITGNTATDSYSPEYASGGGIDVAEGYPIITMNTIVRNTAGMGAGISCGSQGSLLTIVNNYIADNTASNSGGGVYCSYYVSVADNRIAGNAAQYGGGICCGPGSPTIANNAISCNTAYDGGGIYYRTSYYYRYPTIINNTVLANNAANSGGGIYAGWPGRPTTIAGTIIAFNSSGLYVTGSSNLSLRSNCVYSNTGYDYLGLTDPTGTNGNILANPLLTRLPSSGVDGTWGTADDDYGDLHLLAGSPCINTGDPAYVPTAGESDFDGQPRVLYGRVDIGADEYRLAGDCNFDGFVNVGDLQVLVSSWGCSRASGGYSVGADLNGDGYVNVGDLQLLVAGWGKSLQ